MGVNEKSIKFERWLGHQLEPKLSHINIRTCLGIARTLASVIRQAYT